MIREADSTLFRIDADHNTEATKSKSAATSVAEMPSASDLKRRIVNFLASRNRPGLRQLEVQVEGGVVVLKGRVRSYYEKQLASHCCSRVAGVLRVVDGIHVVPEASEVGVG